MTNSTDIDMLGIEPLSARSIILSVLLGSHPPRLASRQLTGFADLFDIRAGTVRTALSRMVASDELRNDDGVYSLGPRLLRRQQEQDRGRSAPPPTWDGAWISAIAAADARSVAERRAFRAAMTGLRMGELRPDIWMRPANIAVDDRPEDVLMITGPLETDDPHQLVAELWPLDELDHRANQILEALDRHRSQLDADDPSVLPATFTLSAAAVRFLRTEPQLPSEVSPREWSPPTVRPIYDEFETAFQRLLRSFLRSLA